MKYDLDQRCLSFSISLFKALKNLKLDFYNNSIVAQVLKSGTSVGVNYKEANNSHSKKELFHKTSICKREIYETVYWLDLIINLYPETKLNFESVLKEAVELSNIFNTIYKKSKNSF